MVESLKNILLKSFQKYPVLAEVLREKKIGQNWAGIVGEALARAVKPVRFSKGVLRVAVASAAWHQEINFRKDELIKKINEFLGKSFVKNITGEVVGEQELAERDVPQRGTSLEWYFPGPEKENLARALERLILMDKKLKKQRREWGGRVCPICGRVFFGRRRFCPLCQAGEKDREFKKIVQLVERQPLKNLLELRKNWPKLKRQEFKQARQFLLDEGEKIINLWKKEFEKNKRGVTKYLPKIKTYLALKTGQPPEKIAANLLKRIFSDKIYYHLKKPLGLGKEKR